MQPLPYWLVYDDPPVTRLSHQFTMAAMIDKTYSCGLFSWHPAWLQWLATRQVRS